MFMWLIKQLMTIRKVLDGRDHPHQLAWGLALGFLVGVVPHGNLMAILLIGIVLSLRVNHSLVALSGVATALLATRFDPLTHWIGEQLLSDPRAREILMTAWQWPLMPWTDLNNTVVLGSLCLGLSMVMPLYGLSYPLFRRLRRPSEAWEGEAEELARCPAEEIPHGEHREDLPHGLAGPHPPQARRAGAPEGRVTTSLAAESNEAEDSTPIRFVPLDPAETTNAPSPATSLAPEGLDPQSDEARLDPPHPPARPAALDPDVERLAVETRIDVIRLQEADDSEPREANAANESEEIQINQALSYLLRRLRDSKEGDAA